MSQGEPGDRPPLAVLLRQAMTGAFPGLALEALIDRLECGR